MIGRLEVGTPKSEDPCDKTDDEDDEEDDMQNLIPSSESELTRKKVRKLLADEKLLAKSLLSGQKWFWSVVGALFLMYIVKQERSSIYVNEANEKLIEEIVILGERHSGTQWLQSKIRICYPHIKVKGVLHRPSYWFQSAPSAVKAPTLVLATFLNSYHWAEAMRLDPMYSPNHVGMSWHSFVKKPWTMPRPENDFNQTKCQHGFEFEQVIPCKENNKTVALYEMRKRGQAYASIIRLRASKIQNIMSLDTWPNVKALIGVRYEDLQSDSGLAKLLLHIENATKVKPSCKNLFMSVEKEYKAGDIVGWLTSGLGMTDPKYIEWMNRNVDWETEALIGYHHW